MGTSTQCNAPGTGPTARDSLGLGSGIAVVLLTCEYVFIAARYDGLLHAREGWWSQLSGIVTATAIAGTATLVVKGRSLSQALRAQAAAARVWQGWLRFACHAACFGVLVLTAEHMRSVDPAHAAFSAWAGVLAVGAVLTAASAFAAFLSYHTVRATASALGIAVIVGAIVGLGAWAAGLATRALWDPLGAPTMAAVVTLLELAGGHAEVGVDGQALGMSGFWVEIAAECAGYEGIGLITVFVAAYLWIARTELRFPHALAIPVAAVILVWGANALRLAALVHIGANYSQPVAMGGFHSMAGWLLFCLVAIAVVTASRRFRLFMRSGPRGPTREDSDNPTGIYLLPLVVLLGTSLATGSVNAGPDLLYPVRVLAAGVALWFSRAPVLSAGWGAPWRSIATGVLVFVAWMIMVPAQPNGDLRNAVLGMQGLFPTAWIAVRVLGASVVIPLVEEMAFRGYLMRRLVSAEFASVDPRRAGGFALVASSLLFGALHADWLAASVAGLAYGFLYRINGRLADAIVAHATTNLMLCLSVLLEGSWYLW